MRKLKEQFTFEYQKQTIKVKKTGSVYSAIFGEVAKPLKIDIESNTISTWENKSLAKIPPTAFEECDPKEELIKIKEYLKYLEL